MFKNNILLQLPQTKILFGTVSSYFIHYRQSLILIGVVASLSWLACQFIRLVLTWKETNKPSIVFEVSPPVSTEQSSFSTSQLFSSLHGILRQRSWLLRLFDVQKKYAFEIVSTKNKGIRYLIRIGSEDSQIVKKNILSYLPTALIKEVEDYLLPDLHKSQVIEITQSHHFAFPLKEQDQLKDYDPIAFVTGNMTKLGEHELVALQAVISPIGRNEISNVSKLRSLYLTNNNLLTFLQNQNRFTSMLSIVLHLLVFPIGIIVWILTNGRDGPMWSKPIKQGSVDSYAKPVEQQVKQKLDQRLFRVRLRFLVVTKSFPNRSSFCKGFIAALSPYAYPGYQTLTPKRRWRFGMQSVASLWLYRTRMLGLGKNMILSTSELSDLYHFPYTSTTKTENLKKLHSKELPAPLSLKQNTELDIYFGKNTFGGTDTKIGLTLEERRRHMYILGATGTGKSTMLHSMILQDIENNKGICVIDPHGDLIEQILPMISKERLGDVVYFNPDDISYPIGINLLELTPGLNSEDALREKEFITESIISLFHKIYTEKHSGPRMEYILRNTIHTAFTVPDATLFTVNKLLINTKFRKSVVATLKDENLKEFWQYEFGKAGDFQKVTMISPITNKIGRFLFSPTAKRIMEQGKSTINFDTIMNQGKILLCNLSKGKIGEDNSSVLGVLIMAKIQLTALKRSRMKPEQRRDFFLYVDEFQNFATPAFAQILSEARKYRLGAILAHQTTSQIEDPMLVNVTLANTGTVICFRTANPEDEKMILPQFRPYVAEGEIASLPAYHFYTRLGALNPEEPFSGVTIPTHTKQDDALVQDLIESSRNLYAKEWRDESKVTKISENQPSISNLTPKQAITFLP